jgi:UDP-GlcNAc:undecaprenyl-phosphate GlcNAc-1-phosphate transferase
MGGLAIYGGFAVTLLVVLGITPMTREMIIGSTLIVGLGIIDDIKELRPKQKLLGQLAVAMVPIIFGTRIQFVTNPFGGGMIHVAGWGIPLTIIWVVAVVNVINLIDGLDGLCAGVSSIASMALFSIAAQRGFSNLGIATLALAGASVGFLRYNFNPAKVFMGDTGSMFLGFVLAVVSLEGAFKSAATIALTVPIIILGIPIFDTLFAIIRRYRRGQPIYTADKEHLHHRLVALGLSQKSAVLVIYFMCAVLGLTAFLITIAPSLISGIFALIICSVFITVGRKIGVIDFGTRRPQNNNGHSLKS